MKIRTVGFLSQESITAEDLKKEVDAAVSTNQLSGHHIDALLASWDFARFAEFAISFSELQTEE